jgi:hypothetical protein
LANFLSHELGFKFSQLHAQLVFACLWGFPLMLSIIFPAIIRIASVILGVTAMLITPVMFDGLDRFLHG